MGQVSAEPIDGIALAPGRHLGLGPVPAGVAGVVAVDAVGIAFDQAGPRAPPGALHGLGDARVHRLDVHAVHAPRWDTERSRPLRDTLAGRHRAAGGVFAVLVVLADVDDRQPPDGGQVEGLVHDALVAGAIAEEAEAHAIGVLDLEGEGDPRCQPDPAAHDPGRADVVVLDFQNENLVARVDGHAVATVPDLICIVAAADAEPITTELLGYGQRVAVVGVPCHPMLRTPEALAVVGPRAFGYELAYRPLPPGEGETPWTSLARKAPPGRVRTARLSSDLCADGRRGVRAGRERVGVRREIQADTQGRKEDGSDRRSIGPTWT
jgi:Protein of unknown function (DUF917)